MTSFSSRLKGRCRSYVNGLSHRSRTVICGVAAVAAAVACFQAAPALAGQVSRSIGDDVLARHEVHDTVNPRGTRIDLYDYWLSGEREWDHKNPDGYLSMGINKVDGDQKQLVFGRNTRGGINNWTGSAKPFANIVQPVLGADGFPWLAAGHQYIKGNTTDLTTPQSLKYLFDGTSFDGKRAHLGTTGLLQLDDDGYYYYDSKRNFATYNAEGNSFTLYDAGAVAGGGRDKQFGEFFPFNTAQSVFKGEGADGRLESTIASNHHTMNHYFGLSLSSNFMQPADGITKNGKEMVFDFAGDDDVWVFIDGVLVGDVGGIHDRTGLTINFATGEVYTYDGSLGGNPDKHYNPTTITSMFRAAQGDAFDASQFDGDSFRDGTYHTLQFYYMERGNENSNLALKFNLVNVAESTMTKVDQLGNPVEGATFDLYATDDSYAVHEGDAPLATGVTDHAGRFSFIAKDGSPLSFMKLHYQEGISHYVLRETGAPRGYRRSPDGKLKFVMSKVEKTLGFLFSDNYWDSGVYAHAEQTLTIENDTVYGANLVDGKDPEYKVEDGTVFAVIYRRVPGDAGHPWHDVSGSTEKGWKVSKDAVATVEDLRDAQVYRFSDDDRDGKYSVSIDDMPGNPEDYYMMSGDEQASKYTVGFYWTRRDAGRPFDIKNIDSENTFRLSGSQFTRQTAANLYVTDVQNILGVQKVDDAGAPVNGARFGIYAAADMVEADGALVPAPAAKPLFQDVTADRDGESIVGAKGLCYLGPLSPGSYYLVEMEAPVGYRKQDKAVRVLVDGAGVHADAGVAGDGITALVSMGSLVDSMAQFAAKDDIDMTLYDVIASCRTARSDQAVVNPDGSISIAWTEDENPDDDIWLECGAADAVLDYGPDRGPHTPAATYGMVVYTVDEGLAMCGVRQNTAYGPGGAHEDPARYGIADWENLQGRDITGLYTGATCVVVENKRVASLAVTKHAYVADGMTGPTEQVDGAEAASTVDELEFKIRFKLADASGKPLAGPFAVAVFEQVDGERVRVDDNDLSVRDGAALVLRNGQTAEVYGLPAGARFELSESEQDMPAGFVQESSVGAAGTVEGNVTKEAVFTNVYKPAPVEVSGSAAFAVEKSFARWDVCDAFAFELSAYGDAPMPAGAQDGVATVTLHAPADGAVEGTVTGSFGNVVYMKPGSYFYFISEAKPEAPVPGVTYSDALYLVTVTVTDNQQGALEASAQMRQTRDDAGEGVASRPIGGPARFVNGFDAEMVGFAPVARKEYIDHVGSRPLEDGMFSFTVEVPKGNPIPNASNEPAKAAQDMTFELINRGNTIQAGQALFTSEDVGSTYSYVFYENVPEGAGPHNGYTVAGFTYDPTRYVACVKVEAASAKDAADGKKARIVLDVSYFVLNEAGERGEQVDLPVFRNSFDADPAADVKLVGEKVLVGRDALEGEEFAFELAAGDEATRAAIASGDVVLGGAGSAGQPVERLTTKVSGLSAAENGRTKVFSFDGISFSRVGTYTFAINEVLPRQDGKPVASLNDVAYDAHTATARVVVTEAEIASDGPALTAWVTYDNAGANDATDRARFTNVYRSWCTSESIGLTVIKTMDGRPLKAGDFAFRIEGDEHSASKLLNESDRRFTNPKAGASGAAEMRNKLTDLLFTQDDLGETFVFSIFEELPQGVDARHPVLQGVTYDLSEYSYEVTPRVAGDGSMALSAKLYRVREVGGEPCGKTLVGSYDGSGEADLVASFANSYATGDLALTDGWVSVAKRLEGRGWKEGDSFEFAMERVSYREREGGREITSGPQFDAMPLPANAIAAATSAVNGGDDAERVARFESMPFHTPGVYSYRVREVAPQGAAAEPGMTYSKDAVEVVVTVVDAGTGRLVAYVEVEGVEEDELATFINVVAPPVEPEPEPDPEPKPEPELPVEPEPDPQPEPGPGSEADVPDRPSGADRLPQSGDPIFAGSLVCAVGAVGCIAIGMRRRISL